MAAYSFYNFRSGYYIHVGKKRYCGDIRYNAARTACSDDCHHNFGFYVKGGGNRRNSFADKMACRQNKKEVNFPFRFYASTVKIEILRGAFVVYEKSCGAVVFTRINNEIKYLLVRNLAGQYGFPKGHAERGETEEQTALREVLEEVGLTVKIFPGFRMEDEYLIPQKENTVKRVVYFLAEYSKQEFSYQKEELTDAVLLEYERAMTLFSFESNRKILTKANNFLLNG